MSRICGVEEAAEELRQGRMVILVDDENRENEGDLVLAAEKVTPQAIAFMAKHGSGLICLALTPEKVEQLQLPLQPRRGPSRYGTAFTVSIEAREGVTTGISAHDRAHTILTAVRPDAGPSDLCTPGHVFPLRARPGGVLTRAGQIFATLTGGRFTDLRADFGANDETILVGVRPSGARVGVEGMSDGTVDQLYLSIRLATLEQYLQGHEPIPFVVDDILIRFDDKRAEAALRVLVDLSQKTQVLFFTHHDRLVEQAQKVGQGRVAVHDLAG